LGSLPPHKKQKWPEHRVHVMWLQPERLTTGALQNAHGVELAVSHSCVSVSATARRITSSLYLKYDRRTPARIMGALQFS